MKRGMVEQTFIFIFALIVVALILAWGTKTVIDLKNTAGQVQLADSIEDIKQKAVVYYNLESGSNAPLNIPFPQGVDCVCFLEIGAGFIGDVDDLCEGDPEFGTWTGNTEDNILVTPTRLGDGPYRVTRFKTIDEFIPVGENPLCFNLRKSRGRLKAVIEARGDHVIIREP